MKSYENLFRIKNIVLWILFALLSVGYVYAFSFLTSWLYPYYFGGDSAQFLTMGKAWYLGKLPYVDMFDHKGPFIFWINMIGYLIAGGEKYGVAVLQMLFLFFTIFAFYQISQLVYKNRAYGVAVVLITLLVMKRNYGDGNTVEEYCLPFICWSFYGILNFWKQSDNVKHSPKWAFLYGLTLGICFLTRVTNFIPLCAGLLLVVIQLLSKKQYQNLLQNIGAGLAGFLLFVLPFLAYFWSKGALYECIYGTLLYNFEYAEARKSWLLAASTTDKLRYLLDYFIALSIFISAFISVLKREYRLAVLWLLTGILEQCMFMSGDAYPQYPLVCIIQIPVLLNELCGWRGKVISLQSFVKVLCGLVLLAVLSINVSLAMRVGPMWRAYSVRRTRIWELLVDEIPEDDLDRFVVYGNNEFKEVYLLKDLMPCYKYFVIQDWQGSMSPETRAAIHDTFATKKAKWILTDGEGEIIRDILEESYTDVDGIDQFHLYRLND